MKCCPEMLQQMEAIATGFEQEPFWKGWELAVPKEVLVPIGIAEVMRSLAEQSSELESSFGKWAFGERKGMVDFAIFSAQGESHWNLLDDNLDHQDQSVIDFLFPFSQK